MNTLQGDARLLAGFWLGVLGVLIFAITLPATRLATGTDAAPYHRIFNPDTQAGTADPDGSYVRGHIPELAHLAGPAALRPWNHPDGYADGYPARIVDHAAERVVALTRYRLAVGR